MTVGSIEPSYTKGLVILVNFADKAVATGTQQEVERMLNETGYSNNHHAGSLHDYFYDQSYGTFDLTFDVAGPVTAAFFCGTISRCDCSVTVFRSSMPGVAGLRINTLPTASCNVSNPNSLPKESK